MAIGLPWGQERDAGGLRGLSFYDPPNVLEIQEKTRLTWVPRTVRMTITTTVISTRIMAYSTNPCSFFRALSHIFSNATTFPHPGQRLTIPIVCFGQLTPVGFR